MSTRQYQRPVPGRHPFEIVVLVALILLGVGGLLSGSARQTSSTGELLGPVWTVLWDSVLIVGSGTALVGLFLREPLSLLIERIGMYVLATACGAFGVAVIASGELAYLRTGTIFLAVAITALYRIGQLTRDIRQWPVTQDIRRTEEEILRTVQVLRDTR